MAVILDPIDIGNPDNHDGDPLRVAMQKVNLNEAALAAAINAAFVPAPLTTALDLDTMVTSGVYHQPTNAGASGGVNYPVPYAGLLQVFAYTTAPTPQFVYQYYTAYKASPGNSRQFWRTYYGGAWSEWFEIIQLDGNGRLPAAMAPIVYSPVLPTTAHDLNDYVTPGNYYQTTNAGATPPVGANYPAPLVGFLEVVATGTPVLQTYTTRNATLAIQQRFWRVRVTSTTWSAWKEVVDTTTTLTYAGRLSAGQDLNTYTTRGIWFASAASIATGGSNYPEGAAGFLTVLSEQPKEGVAQTSGVSQRYEAVTGKVYTRYISASVWSPWRESADQINALIYQGGLASGLNLNDFTQRGMWVQASSAAAAAGTNYPIAQSGYLVVQSAGYPGGAVATGCAQVYHAANTNRSFFRSFVSGSWTAWEETVRSSLLGAASGVAQLGTDSRLLPAQAPIIYSTSVTAGTPVDANTITVPGVYYLNADASATPELNWPERLAGTLNVEAAVTGNQQITQTYTTRNGTGGVLRTYKRVRFGGGAGIWGSWQQLARYDDAMTNVFLTTATDVNTLIAPNVYYTWTSAAVVTGGSNWPSIQPAFSRAFLQVVYLTSSQVHQRLTIPFVGGARPLVYERTMIGAGTWGAWKIVQPVSAVGDMPLADCGDVYVDNVGWHRWNGSAYELSSLATTLPSTSHDLNSYQTPGAYRQASTAGATAGTNYPVSIGGTLNVYGSGTSGQTVQTYTVASTGTVTATAGPRMFWRFAINTTWSPWTEMLSTALGMTHQFLTAATDANTLNADNTWYSWTSGSLMSSGSNFPAGVSAAGYMRVIWQAATIVSQELTVLVTGQKPRTFFRFGNSSTNVWQPWKSTSAQSTASFPTEDCGDIYVDGIGWHRFVGGTYSPSSLPTGYRSGGTMVMSGTVPSRALSIQPFRLRSSDDSVDLIMTSAITKNLQASGNWTAGANGNLIVTGGTGILTMFDIHAIRNDTSGAIDVCAITSGAAVVYPSGWSRGRLLGSVAFAQVNSSIRPFLQVGNCFTLVAGLTMVSNGGLSANNAVLVQMIAPYGRRTLVRAIAHGGAFAPAATFAIVPPDVGQAYGGQWNQIPDLDISSSGGRSAQVDIMSDLQARIGLVSSVDVANGIYLGSQGWTEMEGW